MYKKIIISAIITVISVSAFCDKALLGPTVDLIVKSEAEPDIPIDSFLYFVPLVSPVLVENIISEKNTQYIAITKITRNVTKTTFNVKCHFSMIGSGSCCNKFDDKSIITHNVCKDDKSKVLKGLIDYIKFEGDGYGRFEIVGTIKENKKSVTDVAVFFNDKDIKSPVTVALYDLSPVKLKYDYSKRHDILVGRIISLTFKKCDTEPTMIISLDSVGKEAASDSFFAKFRGFIANLMVPPIGITEVGNNSILEFCRAIADGNDSFTFPLATNLKRHNHQATASKPL